MILGGWKRFSGQGGKQQYEPSSGKKGKLRVVPMSTIGHQWGETQKADWGQAPGVLLLVEIYLFLIPKKEEQYEQAWLLEKHFPCFLRIPCFGFSFLHPFPSPLPQVLSLFLVSTFSSFPSFISLLLSQVAVIVSELIGPPAFNSFARLSLKSHFHRESKQGLRAVLDITTFNELRVRRISKVKRKRSTRVRKRG